VAALGHQVAAQLAALDGRALFSMPVANMKGSASRWQPALSWR
jgi:hypothetical protein